MPLETCINSVHFQYHTFSLIHIHCLLILTWETLMASAIAHLPALKHLHLLV